MDVDEDFDEDTDESSSERVDIDLYTLMTLNMMMMTTNLVNLNS